MNANSTLLRTFSENPEAVIFIIIYMLGFVLSVSVWEWRYGIDSKWHILNPLRSLDFGNYKHLFLQGPSIIFIIISFLIAWLTSIYLTPYVVTCSL